VNIKHTLQIATEQLKVTSESARLDAEVLLSHVLQKPTSYLYAYPELELEKEASVQFQTLLLQRKKGMPIAYLTGKREFWSIPLKVTQDTLIPRADTEKLVEVTLEVLKDTPKARILELGTGTGAVAIALAKEKPAWEIHALDNQEKVLEVARENALLSQAKFVKFFLSDWFTHCPKLCYHAIISNPPYIAEQDPHLFEGDVRFEPKQALVSGKNGLKDIHFIIANGYHYLLPGGQLILEHGYDQKEAIASILYETGYTDIHCWQDWQGQDRISRGVWK
jgi:release factor glutamine methyltransferase